MNPLQLSNSISNCNNGPKSVQELAVLQATLFSLQQQQLLQMQILSQMSKNQIDPDLPEVEAPAAPSVSDGAVAATRVMAELAKKMQLAPTFEEKKQELPPPPPSASIHSPLPSTPVPPTIKPKSATGGGILASLSSLSSLSNLADKPEEKSPFARSSSPVGGGSSLRLVIITYRVTMVVRDYILLTLFLKFLNLEQLLCHFCPILTRPKKLGRQWNN